MEKTCSKCNLKCILVSKRTICKKCYNLEKLEQLKKRKLEEREGICSKCNKNKILLKNKYWCRECKNEYEKNRRKLNRSKYNEIYREYYLNCNKNNRLCSNCKYITGQKRYISKTNTYEKVCADCFYKLYPDEKKIPTKYKRKQHYIHEKLKEKYGEDFFKYDIRVECGCSRKIPDWFIDCYNFVLNIECDENQHKGNDTSCENKRLCELFLDCAERPFVCIRFNPDNYKIEDKKIEGCFTFDEKNNIIVNQEEFEKRFELLVEKIDYYLENGSKKNIECIKLFYDY